MAQLRFIKLNEQSIKKSKPVSYRLKIYIKILLFVNIIEGLVITYSYLKK